MSRAPRHGLVASPRDRLRQAFLQSPAMRDSHPQLEEVRVEIEFLNVAGHVSSPQAFSYFSGARGFFRYACPRHGCTGEIDLTSHVAQLAHRPGRVRRSNALTLACTAAQAPPGIEPCPVSAHVTIAAKPKAGTGT